MQKLIIWILVTTKRHLAEGSSSLIIFESECLATIVRGEMESRSSVKNLHPELNLMQALHDCCRKCVLELLGTAFFNFHLSPQGQSCNPTITVLSLCDIHLHTHLSLLHRFFFQSWLLFFSFSYFEGGRERQKMHFTV